MKLASRAWLLVICIWASSWAASGAPAPEPSTAPPPPTESAKETLRLAAQHGHRSERPRNSELNPAVFTGIRPYTTDEQPVRLPPDQALD